VSILTQSHQEFELLLILPKDVCTTHPDLASLPQDPRIQYLHRDSSGIVSALNTGIAAAKGKWLARMDADDIAHPQRFGLQLELLSSDEAIDFCSSTVQIFSEDQPLGLFKRSVIEAIGGYRNTEWAEDYDFLLRAAQAGLRFGKPAMKHGTLLKNQFY